MTRVLRTAVALALGLALSPPAAAHHVMGGELPGTMWEGLLSGLGHPIIGLDHLAFIIGVGALAHLMGLVVILPVAFVAGTVVGCGWHILGHSLPAAELAVTATVAIAAVLVAMRLKPGTVVVVGFVALAGLFHGYAYGESIVGAEATPLAAYILGFGIIQGALAVGTALALGTAVGRDYLSEAGAMRLAGAGLALVAVFVLATAAVAG